MYRRRKILAIIPARGGSKGLPKKNTKNLLGKPLIAWTIEQALASKYLDKVIVNTDDNLIARIAEKYGAEVPFMRPKELARDNSRVIDTVLHTLDYFDGRNAGFDYVALLEPTSPLREKNDIDSAIKNLIDREKNADSIISTGEIALEHPVYVKKIDKGGYAVPYAEMRKTGALRQELPAAYFPYGVIYCSKVSAIRKHRAVYGGKILAYLIERWQNYEINDILDFLCVESVLKHKKEI